jgi:hypothetical protein
MREMVIQPFSWALKIRNVLPRVVDLVKVKPLALSVAMWQTSNQSEAAL